MLPRILGLALLALTVPLVVAQSTCNNEVPEVSLQLIASNLGVSTSIRFATPPGFSHSLMFAAQQSGQVIVADVSGMLGNSTNSSSLDLYGTHYPDVSSQFKPMLLLDLSNEVMTSTGISADEPGLIGLAFHPNFTHNGR